MSFLQLQPINYLPNLRKPGPQPNAQGTKTKHIYNVFVERTMRKKIGKKIIENTNLKMEKTAAVNDIKRDAKDQQDGPPILLPSSLGDFCCC